MPDSIDWTDETIRTLDELAQMAFPADSGVTAKTLKHLARQGKLIVYRPGKAYLSTMVNVRAALEATRVKPANPRPAKSPVTNAVELTEKELARMRLDQTLQGLDVEMKEKKQAERRK